MFPQYAHELLKICEEEGIHLGEAAIRHEMEESGVSREEVRADLAEVIRVMKVAATEGKRRLVFSLSGLIGGDSTKYPPMPKPGRRSAAAS